MFRTSSRHLSACAMAALLAACGGGSRGGSNARHTELPTAPTASLALLLSDASNRDWASIGVKVLSIALVPQGGGDDLTVYAAPSPAPMINLVDLDRIAELLGNSSVPVGTYAGAVLTVSGNPSDILLTAAADPHPGFAAAPGARIAANQIRVQHALGSGANLSTRIAVAFGSPLIVSANQRNALDLEFDLSHPAFLIGHGAPGAGDAMVWDLNFEGSVRHQPVHDFSQLLLRHMYGHVQSVDNRSLSIRKALPTEPAVAPEAAPDTPPSLLILADAQNGTILYDVDARSHMAVKDFSMEGDLLGKYVRIAARYREDGTLIATRIWSSGYFNSVWRSPEGHVLHVDPRNAVVTIESDAGRPVAMSVDAGTQFFFRRPQDPAADSAPIGAGPEFLANRELARGFKVHATAVDPSAKPLVAQSIDIEAAAYGGALPAPLSAGFTYTRNARSASDGYPYALEYLADTLASGSDAGGIALLGYGWWSFAYPLRLARAPSALPLGGAAGDRGGTGRPPRPGVSEATPRGRGAG